MVNGFPVPLSLDSTLNETQLDQSLSTKSSNLHTLTNNFPTSAKEDTISDLNLDAGENSDSESGSESDSDSEPYFDCYHENPYTKMVTARLLEQVDQIQQQLSSLRREIVQINSQ